MHADIKAQFPALAFAAKSAASPQIRNVGTIGGNIGQDTRCWYYRDGWTCYRAGGNICYASPPTAMNREHCILGASRCVAVNPVRHRAGVGGARGGNGRPAWQRRTGQSRPKSSFVGPEIDIERMTALEPGDLLMSIRSTVQVGRRAGLLREGPRPR